MGFRSFWREKGMLFGVGAIALFALALVPLALSAGERFDAAMGQAYPHGMFGMDGETPDERVERLARAAQAASNARLARHVAEALAFAGVLSAARAAAQTRGAIRSWHWLAFGGFVASVTSVALVLVLRTPYARFSSVGFVVLALLGVVLPIADLTRRRRGPGRVFAWIALALACLVLLFLRAAR